MIGRRANRDRDREDLTGKHPEQVWAEIDEQAAKGAVNLTVTARRRAARNAQRTRGW